MYNKQPMSELLEHLGHMGSLLGTLIWVRAHLAHRQWNPRGRSDTLETYSIQLSTIDLLGKDTHIRGARALVYLQHPSGTPGGHPDTGGAQGVGRTHSRHAPSVSVPSIYSERTPILEVFGHSYTFST